MIDEIACEMCGLVLPYDHFSRQQRKLDDPVSFTSVSYRQQLSDIFSVANAVLHGQRPKSTTWSLAP